MKSRWPVFNVFLALAICLFSAGCETWSFKKKDYSNIRVHVEADRGGDAASAISIHRSAPILLNIQREPVLDEHDVEGAVLIEQPGSTYAIQVKFNRRGSWILERTTVTERGRHLAIYSFFTEGRWLAAPIITGKNSTGMLTFTPDATREEAERIVRGLNNVVRKLQYHENWPFSDTIDK